MIEYNEEEPSLGDKSKKPQPSIHNSLPFEFETH